MLLGLALVGVVVIGALWGLQRRLIYFPTQAVPAPPADVVEVQTRTDDGLVLHGWTVPAVGSRDEVPLVIVFHGNGGTHADRLVLGRALAAEGVGVLLAGYRGYGGNPGTPSEEGFIGDARAWRAWADAEHDGPVAYYGESIGAAVATRLATHSPPAALVLRSPFTSLDAVGRVHYPWLPLTLLLRDRFPVADLVGDIDAPVLVVLGTADRLVPPAQSRQVHAAARTATLLEVPGAGHNDRVLLDGEALITAVVELVTPG